MPINKGSARGGGSQPIRTRLPYRGQKIQKVSRPIFLSCYKEPYIDPNDAFDQGVLTYFSNKKDVTIRDEAKGKAVGYKIFGSKHMDLDQMINAEKSTELLDKIGISKYLTGQGAGILPVGRTDVWYPSKEDFNDDYDATYKDFIALLQEDEQEHKAFMEAADSLNMNVSLETLKQGIDKKKFGHIHTAYLLGRISSIPAERDFFNADVFADAGVTRYIHDEEANQVKAQGFLMSLGNTLYWIDPFSSNGSTTLLRGTLEQKLPLLRKELELDQDENVLKRNAGNGKLEDYVKQQGPMTSVSLIRYESDSPITFVPLMDLSYNEEQFAVISMGHINPITKRQQNSLVVKVEKQ